MKARGFVRSARRVFSVDGSFTIMGGPSRLAAERVLRVERSSGTAPSRRSARMRAAGRTDPVEAPAHHQRFWLVEAHLPEGGALVPQMAALRRAAGELTVAGSQIECVRAIAVPDDEVCFFLLVAGQDELVCEAARRARLSVARVSAAEVVGASRELADASDPLEQGHRANTADRGAEHERRHPTPRQA